MKQDALFHHIVFNYPCVDWDKLWDHLRDAPWKDIFRLTASAAEYTQAGIDVYIPHHNHQVKPHSSPRFSTSSAAATVHRNHFCLHQYNKSLESKVKFRQASNETKECITCQKLGSRGFWQIANSVLNRGKSAITLLFNSPEVLSSASDKGKLFAKNISKNSNLDN